MRFFSSKELPDRPTLFNRRHGIAIYTKMIACAVVQIVSIICPSRLNLLVCLFRMILIIVYITVLMIINLIIKACSWKKINCSQGRI